jgi:hypothetical protein
VRTWSHKSDFSGCQALADETRSREIAWIRYAAVRVAGGICGAVLEPRSLSLREPFEQQTWACKATADGAWLQRAGGGRYDFPAADWK